MGILKNLRKKFGEMINIVLGRNSATKSIIAVEIIVLAIRIRRSESINVANSGPKRPGKYKTINNKCNIIANQHCGNILSGIICK